MRWLHNRSVWKTIGLDIGAAKPTAEQKPGAQQTSVLNFFISLNCF